MYWSRVQIAGPQKGLTKLEGVIDNSSVTYDAVRSDLAVRASKALEAGDTKSAETLYREMVSRWPTDPETHSSLAACLYFQQDYGAAQSEYDRALLIDPRSARALYGSGCVAYKQKRYGLAQDYLQKGLEVHERHIGCHRLLGLVHQATGDRAAAITHFERAIELATVPGEVDEVRQWLAELKR
jgi:tetratricopeptide (TPR) repeat protein